MQVVSGKGLSRRRGTSPRIRVYVRKLYRIKVFVILSAELWPKLGTLGIYITKEDLE